MVLAAVRETSAEYATIQKGLVPAAGPRMLERGPRLIAWRLGRIKTISRPILQGNTYLLPDSWHVEIDDLGSYLLKEAGKLSHGDFALHNHDAWPLEVHVGLELVDFAAITINHFGVQHPIAVLDRGI